MKLHFLGTTGYHPNNTRQTACLMLPELGVILDAGTGIFRARDLIQTETLDIFLSHVHLDHCIGLTFLYDVLWDRNVQEVNVHVDEAKIETLKDSLYDKNLFPVGPNFNLIPLRPSVTLGSGVRITSIPVEHPGGCHAFRLDGGGLSLAYVTDTVAADDADYVQAITGVDTLIHECYFPDGWEERAQLTGHSCLTPVANVAVRSGAKRLYLVHINPLNEDQAPLDLASIESVFSATTVANDHDVIDV